MDAKLTNLRVNKAGANAIRNSSGVQAKLLKMAQAVANGASSSSGKNYVADVRLGKTRAHALVKPGDYDAVHDNLGHNTILKNMSRASGA